MGEKESISIKRIIESILIWVTATVICAILLTAGNIVWTSASTWKEELNTTKNNLETVIGNLSTKLSVYEIQFENQSNQINLLRIDNLYLRSQTTNLSLQISDLSVSVADIPLLYHPPHAEPERIVELPPQPQQQIILPDTLTQVEEIEINSQLKEVQKLYQQVQRQKIQEELYAPTKK
jgi:hypothetical protein